VTGDSPAAQTAKHTGRLVVKSKPVITVIAPKSVLVKHASNVNTNKHPKGPLRV
jgi:hypothetical protein